MSTSEKVYFHHSEPLGKVTFLKVLISDVAHFGPAPNVLFMTETDLIGMDSCKHTVQSLDRLFFQTILRCIKSLDIPDDCGWRSDPYNWFPQSLNDLADGTT